jgi:tetratricopeptide (TPR) repeat protein
MGRHHEELATRAYEQGNLVLATMEFRAAVEVFRNPAVPRNHLPRTLLGLATALSDTRLFQEASAAADEAVSILRAERSADPQDQGVLGRALQVLGAITAEMGSVERALSYGYEAVSILRLADSGPDASAESHRDLGRALSNLAGLTQRTGRAEEAVAVSREAVSVLEELNAGGQLAANDATYGRVILGHARIVATAQGPEGALEQTDRALAEFARIAAADPASERAMAPELASAYGLRSVVCAQLGLLTPALASGEQAVEGYSDLVDLRPGFNPDLARSLVHLAELRLQAGLAARAVADCQRAVELLDGLLATSRGVSASVSSLNRDLANARDLLARSRAAVWGND